VFGGNRRSAIRGDLSRVSGFNEKDIFPGERELVSRRRTTHSRTNNTVICLQDGVTVERLSLNDHGPAPGSYLGRVLQKACSMSRRKFDTCYFQQPMSGFCYTHRS